VSIIGCEFPGNTACNAIALLSAVRGGLVVKDALADDRGAHIASWTKS
jgi:hypothetical protein